MSNGIRRTSSRVSGTRVESGASPVGRTRDRYSKRVRAALAMSVAGLGIASVAQAANPNYYWTGTSPGNSGSPTLWTTTTGGTNWSTNSSGSSDPGTTPDTSKTDNVYFYASNGTNLVTALGQNVDINSLNFTGNSIASVTIGGGAGYTLTLESGGLTVNSNSAAASINDIINANVIIGAAQTWTNDAVASGMSPYPTTLTIGGQISGSAALTLDGSGSAQIASGLFVFSGTNSYTGALSLGNDYTSLTLSGNGSLTTATSITLAAGSSLTLDDSVTNLGSNRLGSAVPINSHGGTISMNGNTLTAASETIGTLGVDSGATYVNVNYNGATAALTLGSATVPSLSRAIGGTVIFSDNSNTTIKLPDVTLVNTSIAANSIIGGWATIGGYTGTLDWATVSSGNVVPLAAYQTLTTTPLATDNAKGGSGTITLASGAQTCATLYLTATGGVTTTNVVDTLTIGQGGIISNGATTTLNFSGHVAVANGTIIGQQANAGGNSAAQGNITSSTSDLNVWTASSLRIASIITGNIGLTKSGPGVLDLSLGNTQTTKTTNTFTGIVTINEGTLLINAEAQLGNCTTNNTILVANAVTFNGGSLITYAGDTIQTDRGFYLGTRGGLIAYSGGSNTILDNPISGPGGLTLEANDFLAGGGGETMHFGNTHGVGVNGNTYLGPTALWMVPNGNANNSPMNHAGAIQFDNSNQIPILSAVTANLVSNTGATLSNSNNSIVNAVNLNGTTQTFGSLAGNLGFYSSGAAPLNIGGNGQAGTYSGVMGNSNGAAITVTINGPVTETFSGANAYTGGTTVSGGTFSAANGLTTSATSSATGTGTVAVSNAATISGSATGGTILGLTTINSGGILAPSGTLQFFNGGLTINSGSVLNFTLGAVNSGVNPISSPNSDNVYLAGTAGLTMSGTDTLNITGASGFGAGMYNLITVGGTGAATFGGVTFNVSGPNTDLYAVSEVGKTLVLTVTVNPNPSLTWVGSSGTGTWDVVSSDPTNKPWKASAGGAAGYTDGAILTFDNTPGANSNISITSTVMPSSMTFNNNASNNYTFTGAAIAGSTGFSTQGVGTITFSNVNTFTGSASIQAGTVIVGGSSSGQLADSSYTISSGAALTINSNGALLGTPTVGNSGTLTFNIASQTLAALNDGPTAGTGVITLNGTALTLTGASAYGGSIANGASAGSVTVNASGSTVILSGNNTYTGSTTITAGTLQIGAGLASGSISTTTGNISNGGALVYDVGSPSTITQSNSITGSGSLSQIGSGMVTLTGGSNSYTGGTTVSAGTLQLSGSATLGSVNANLVVNGGTLDLNSTSQAVGTVSGNGGAILNSGSGTSTLTVGNATIPGTGNYAGAIENNAGTGGTVAVIKNGSGTLTLSGLSSYTGATTINTGALVLQDTTSFASPISVTSTGTLDLDRTVTSFASRSTIAGGTITGSGIINVNNAANSVPGMTTDGGWVIVNNGGASTLNFSGTINVNSGVLATDNGGSVTGTALVNVASGAVLSNHSSSSFVIGGLTGSGDITPAQNNTNVYNMNIGNGVAAGTAYTFSGIIHGNNTNTGNDGAMEAGILSITKSGAGTEILSGINTYIGGTTVAAGLLQISGSGTLGGGTGPLTVNGGVLDLNSSSQAVGNFLGTGGTILNSGTGTSTLTIGNNNGTDGGTFAGVIEDNAGTGGTVALSKVGSGTITLSGGNSTFSGGTTVSAGSLLVTNATGSATSSTLVTVQTGGTLGGTGIITGPVTINSGGTLTGTGKFGGIVTLNGTLSTPAGAAGTGTITLGSLISTGGSTLNFNFAAAANDKATVTGAATLSGTDILNINALAGFAGGTFTLLTAAGGLTDSASFTINPVGVNPALTNLSVQQVGNSLVLTVTGGNTTWTGAAGSGGNGTWDNTSANWSPSPTGTFTNLQSAVFDDTGINTNITVGTGGINQTGMAFSNSSNTYTITSSTGNVITGSGGLTLTGTGTVNLAGPNTFTGVVTLNAGILNVATLANGGAASPIGQSTNAAGNVVFNGGTLQYTGATVQSTDHLFTLGTNGGSIDGSGSVAAAVVNFTNAGTELFSNSGARTLTLTGSNVGNYGSGNAGQSFVLNTFSGTLTDQNAITGQTTLVKNGTGAWTLTNANDTYTGGTNINNGALQISSSKALGGGPVNVAAPAQLIFQFQNQSVANNITLNGIFNNGTLAGALVGDNVSGGATNTLAGTLTLAATSNISTAWSDKIFNITGQITGAGGLQVDLYLAGNQAPVIDLANNTNNFQGGLIVNAGTINTTAAGVIPSGASAGNVKLAAGTTLNLNGFSQSINGLNSTGTVNGTSGTPTLTLGGSVGPISSFGGLIQNNGAVLSLAMNGTGTQALTANNTYTGGTTITAGTLQLSGAGTMGPNTNTLAINGGVLDLDGTSQTVGIFTGSGGTILNSGTGTSTLTVSPGGSFAGSIENNAGAGTGIVALTKNGAGALTLSGTSSYTGTTTVTNGTLIGTATNAFGFGNLTINATATSATVDSTGAIGSAAIVTVTSGAGIATLNVLDATPTIAQLNGNAASLVVLGQPSGGGTTTLRISNGGTFNGTIEDNSLLGGGVGSVAANGGTLILTGAETYTGTTFINGGATLQMGTGSISGSLLPAGAIIDNGTLTFNRSNAVVQGTDFSTAAITGSGALTQAGSSTLTLSANNTYSGTTSATNGALIINGSNTSAGLGAGTVSATNTTNAGLTVISIRNANALGSGSVDSGLAPITLNATGTNLSASILEIGATIGTDPGPYNADFSYQVVAPGNNGAATNAVAGNGQINLGFLSNNNDGTGFAAYNASSLSTPRIVALYTPTPGSTTLATLQEKYQFGQGSGDHLTLGSPTANNTLILENPIDLYGGPSRRWASIRGVGIVPEGEYAGPIINSAGTALDINFDGNGGLIFANAASTYPTAALQVNGGAVFVAASDPADGVHTGALGLGTATLQVGTSAAVNPAGGAVATLSTANVGFMTYGSNLGVGASITEVTNRLIAVGGSGVTYNSAVLGGMTDDYSAMNGNIALNEAATTPTTFFARNGGRVDFGGVISGVGSVTVGGNAVTVEGNTVAGVSNGIPLANNGVITFNGANTYTGATTVSTGKLYINGNGAAPVNGSPITVNSGATLGGMGTINGLVTVNAGGFLETGQAGAGALTLTNGLTFTGAATINVGALSTSTPSLTIGGAIITGGNTVTLDITGGITSPGLYQLVNYPGITTSTFALGSPLPDRATGTLSVNGNVLDLNVTALSSIVWTGGASNMSGNGTWDTATSNWSVNSSPTMYVDSPGDSVVFDDTVRNGYPGITSASVTVNGADVHPSSVTFNNNLVTYTVSGTNAIAGSTGLTLTGNATPGMGGTVILLNTNSYSGATSVGPNATLQLGNGAAGHDGNILSTSSIGVGSGGVIDFDLAGSQIYSGVISGNGTLAVGANGGGTGSLTLTKANTYGGGTNINSGTLQLGLGTFNNDGTITGNVYDNGTVAFNYFGNQTFAGQISGGGSVTKSGPGVLQLTGNNSYGGGTTLNAGGMLQVGATGLGDIAGTFTFAGSNTLQLLASVTTGSTYNFAINSGVTATIDTQGNNLVVNGNINGAGNVTKLGTGTLELTGTNNYAGVTNITNGTLQLTTPSALYNANTANWTPANISLATGTTLYLNVDNTTGFSAAQASTLLTNLTTNVNNNGLHGNTTVVLDTSNTTAPLTITAPIQNSTGTGGGTLSFVKNGGGMMTLSGSSNYTGTTTVNGGELVLTAANAGNSLVTIFNNNQTNPTANATILSVQNAGALGSGAANTSLAPITMNIPNGDNLSTVILEVGGTIGTDPGGHGWDFTYQVVNEGATPGMGQIQLGALSNNNGGTGFAGWVPNFGSYSSTNLPPSRYVGLYTNAVGSTTLATLQEKTQFGQGSGDHLTLGAPDANTTVVIENPVDLNGGPYRRFASIRGVGLAPEGEYAGAITNTAGGTNNVMFDGNGGVIFANAGTSYTAATLQIDGGAVFVAASDPAATGQTGALGQGNATLQIGTSVATNPAGGGTTLLATTAGAHLGFMTYGPNAGVGSTPTETTNRPITVGGTGVTYNSVVIGGVTNDYSAMNGNILLTGDLGDATPFATTFFARNGGRVDFGGVISGAGSVQIGGSSVVVEGDSTAAGIALSNNGTIVFNGANSYSGATSVATGKLYVNNNTAGKNPSAITVSSGAAIGGMGTINGLVTLQSGGILEAGQGGIGALTLNSGLTLNGTATFNYPGLPAYTMSGGGSPSLAVGTALNGLTGSTGQVTVNITGSISADGYYPLVGGIPTGSLTDFALSGALPDRASGSLVVDPLNSNQLDLDVTSVGAIYWTGANNPTGGVNGSSTSWDVTSYNWAVGSAGGTHTQFIDNSDSVVFDDNVNGGAGPISVTINGSDVHPSSVTFNNTLDTYTISGANAIAGNTGISLTGTGTVILENVNTYTGATVIGAGATLQLGNGASGNDGSIANTSGISDGGTLIYDVTTPQTFIGVITGNGSVTVQGSGTITLTNSNNYMGGTTVNGTLQLGNGTFGNNGSVTGNITGIGTLIFNPFGTVNNTNTIGGSLAVVKTGPGTVTLAGSNSYTGGTTVTAGLVAVASDGATGSNAALGLVPNTVQASNITLNGGALSLTAGSAFNTPTINSNRGISLGAGNGTINIPNPATGAFGSSEVAVQYSGAISGSGSLSVTGGAGGNSSANPYILELGSGSTYMGSTTINNAIVAFNNGNTVTSNILPTTTVLNLVNNGWLNFNNGMSNQQVAGLTGDATGRVSTTNQNNGSVLTIDPATGQSYNFPGVIGAQTILGKAGNNAELSVVINGAGTQIMTGVSTYTGTTTVSSGTLQLNGGGQVNGQGGTLSVGGTGVLALNAANLWENAGNGATAGFNNPGFLTVNAGGQVTSNGTDNVLPGMTFNGGTLVANGGNSSSWGAYQLEGTINAGTTGVATTASTVYQSTVNPNNFLELGVQNTATNTTFVVNSTGSTAADLTIAIPINDSGNHVAGSGNATSGLIKQGMGTLAIIGGGWYSGGTDIQTGTLVGGGPLGKGTVTIESGAHLVIGSSGAAVAGIGLLDGGLAGQYISINGLPNMGNGANGPNPQFATLSLMQNLFATQPITTGRTENTLNEGKTGANFAPIYDNNGSTNFAMLATGILNINTGGSYTFGLNSDDGSIIYIDGQVAVNDNDYQGTSANPFQVQTAVTLTAGQHTIAVGYFQGTGGDGLVTGVSGPDTGSVFKDLAAGNIGITPDVVVQQLTGSGNITLTTGNLIVGGSNNNSEFDGDISGVDGIQKVGTGILTLTGNNTYGTGNLYVDTNITSGTLQIGNNTLASGTLGSGPVINNATLAFNRPDNGLTVSNAISGTGVVNQVGSGATSLSGTNTYSGGTNVSAGTLLAMATTTSTGTGPVTVTSGRLGGTGSLGAKTTGAVTINGSTAVISPGADPANSPTSYGTLNTIGDLNLTVGTYLWKTSIADGGTGPGVGNPASASAVASTGGQDFLIVGGNLDIESGFILNIEHPGPAWTANTPTTTFVIANAKSVTNGVGNTVAVNGFVGNFQVEDNGMPVYGDTVQVVSDSGSGEDLVVTVTPEPGSLALLGVASLGLLRRRKRSYAK